MNWLYIGTLYRFLQNSQHKWNSFFFFHVASVFSMKGLRTNLREKNLFWIDMALRFLTSTLNAFSESLVMKIFYKSKFMLKEKCIFNNFVKGEWVTKTLKGIHLCINLFIFKHLNTWISSIKFYNYYNTQSHSSRILKYP